MRLKIRNIDVMENGREGNSPRERSVTGINLKSIGDGVLWPETENLVTGTVGNGVRNTYY